MIYGAYNTKNTELDFSFLKKIRKNLSFPQGIHYSFDYKSFVGGFFINPIFPKGKKDFFYCSTSKDIVVIKAGTIFNSNELSNYFLKEDQLSEPEFIAKSFLKFGVNFLNDLNGDFIIVIFSPIKNELLIARDQVGIQPLAYTIKNNEFLFSSDEMALCKSLYNEDIIDSEWLLSPFKLMDPKVSVNPNVKKLTPGNFLKISKKEFIDKPYWFPENISENKKLTFPDVIKDLNLLVEDAVKIRSDQRYFAGTHLSGGLDSGIIAILSKKYSSHQKKFFAFSYAPKNHSQQRSSFDERILVKEIADQNKMNLIFTDFENDDLLNFIKNYYENLGGIWEEKIRKNAQKLKVNLIFSGWGGDQFFSI